MISKAAAFHDIGKISISENILNKPGRLTEEEFEIMKTHSAVERICWKICRCTKTSHW